MIDGNVAIKLFSFKEKDATKLIPAAKQWAFSAEELKDRYNLFMLYANSTFSIVSVTVFAKERENETIVMAAVMTNCQKLFTKNNL